MSSVSNLRRGLAGSFGEFLLARGMGLVVQIAIARQVAPEAFGIIASASLFFWTAAVLADGGLGQALIQRREVSRTDVSTIWITNLVLAGIAAGCFKLLAPAVAAYFYTPELLFVLPLLGLELVIAAGGQPLERMLERNLAFGTIFKVSAPANVIAGVTGIALAHAGWGVGAILAHRLTLRGMELVLLWWHCPADAKPDFRFRFTVLRSFMGLGSGLLGSNLLMQVTRNLHEAIIAKLYSTTLLGFYVQARYFQRVPSEALVRVLNRVLFPVFAQLQDRPDQLVAALRRGIPLHMSLVCLFMFGLIATADPLVPVLLGDSWSGSIPFLQIVPWMGVTFCLAAVKSNVIRALGDGRAIFLLSLTRCSLSLLVLVFTARLGVTPMVVGQTVCYFVNLSINDLYIARKIALPFRTQLFDWLPWVAIGWLSASITQWLWSTHHADNDILNLAGIALTHVALYATSALLLARNHLRVMRDTVFQLKTRFSRNPPSQAAASDAP